MMIKKTTHVLFSENINDDTVNDLIKQLQEIKGHITLGLNSGGGNYDAGKFLLHFLNSNSKNITLVGTGNLFSMAFDIFYNYEGKKNMIFGTRGMYHYCAMSVELSATLQPNFRDSGKCQLKTLSIYRKANRILAKKIMTRKEYKRFKDNNDIYFDFNRMCEIFPDVEIC